MHCLFATMVYLVLRLKLANEVIYKIVDSAVTVEKVYANDVLIESFLGFTAKMMCDYVEFVGDYVLGLFRLPKKYNKECPFDFMNSISLDQRSNIHERKSSEYAKSKGNEEMDKGSGLFKSKSSLFNEDALK